MELQAWLLFVIIWSATTAPVGPNVINCISVSQGNGLARALWTVPGIGLAALVHISIGLTGLAALIIAQPTLFTAVKLVGAAYMLYMAYRAWTDRGHLAAVGDADRLGRFQVMRTAFTISITNPKAIFVNVAIFSQFINAEHPLALQLAVLIPTALLIDAMIYGAYCALGAQLAKWLQSARRQRLFNRSVSVIYAVVSVGLLAYEAPEKVSV
ncbi:MAG: LysE family translocator [Pseudomonadales bacterium]